MLLEPAFFDQLDGAAALVDLVEYLEDALLIFVGQRLDIIGAAERIDDLVDVGFVGNHLLRAQRKLHGVFGRYGECLVITVGVQRLGAAQHRR